MKQNILIVNDVAGYGRTSTTAMLPVINRYGIHSYLLPTAIISNATEYDGHETLDTTEYMRRTVKHWDKLGFRFDYIATGLINTAEQVNIIKKLIELQDSPYVMVDPIMADNGTLYDGMCDEIIDCNKKLASIADLLIPNFTEATFLTGKYVGKTELTMFEYEDLCRELVALGPKNIVISGCILSEGKEAFNLIYESDNEIITPIFFEPVNDAFVGTGDIFSAVIISEIMIGSSLFEAVKKASDFVRKVIINNAENPDHYDLDIENNLLFL